MIEQCYYKCHLNDIQINMIKKNPHCLEYFCTYKNMNIHNDNDKNKGYNFSIDIRIDENNRIKDYCSLDGINKIRKFYKKNAIDYNNSKLDNYKINNDIEKVKLITKLTDIRKKNLIEFEEIYPRPFSCFHFGQLKLLCTTIYFLSKIVKENKKYILVYAGTVTGENILILAKLFLNIKWLLYDPKKHPINFINNKPDNIDIYQTKFTTKIAKYLNNLYKDENLIFLCDIRLDNLSEEKDILLDNELTIEFMNILKPKYAYLKLNIPWNKSNKNYKYKFFDGKIYFQPFNMISGIETRILVKLKNDKFKYKFYSQKNYEKKLFFYNRIIRTSLINNLPFYQNLNNQYFDHCNDCSYYAYILNKYDKKYSSSFKNNYKYESIENFMIILYKELILLLGKEDKLLNFNENILSNLM